MEENKKVTPKCIHPAEFYRLDTCEQDADLFENLEDVYVMASKDPVVYHRAAALTEDKPSMRQLCLMMKPRNRELLILLWKTQSKKYASERKAIKNHSAGNLLIEFTEVEIFVLFETIEKYRAFVLSVQGEASDKLVQSCLRREVVPLDRPQKLYFRSFGIHEGFVELAIKYFDSENVSAFNDSHDIIFHDIVLPNHAEVKKIVARFNAYLVKALGLSQHIAITRRVEPFVGVMGDSIHWPARASLTRNICHKWCDASLRELRREFVAVLRYSSLGVQRALNVAQRAAVSPAIAPEDEYVYGEMN